MLVVNREMGFTRDMADQIMFLGSGGLVEKNAPAAHARASIETEDGPTLE